MTKKISEVTITVKGKGIKATNTEIKKLLSNIEETTAAAKVLNNSLEEGGRTDAQIGRIADAIEEVSASMTQLKDTSRKTLGVLENQLLDNADAAEAAGNAADKLGKEWQGLGGKNLPRLANGLKDTNRQGTNQVRTFSKMARSAGGLTIIYAAVAANVFALSEAFRIMNESASVDRLSEIAGVISNEVGVSIIGTAEALRKATDNAISFQEALKLSSASAAFGFDTEQMEKLAIVAKRASIVLGVDMQDALNRVTRGIAKQEVELLDELGLTVRLTESFAEYAASHGVAVKSLTSFQRQQALTNTVIKKSDQNLGAVDSKLQSTSWEKFGAEVSTATNELLRAISTSSAVTSALDSMADGLAALRTDYTNFKLLLAGNDKDAQIDLIDSAGIAQFEAAYNTGADTLKGMLGAQVRLEKEIQDTAAEMAKLVDSGEFFNKATGKTTREYDALNARGAILREHLTLASLLTKQTGSSAKGVLDTFRSLTKSGQDFTNSLKVAENTITGTAVQTLEPLLLDIAKAQKQLDSARAKAGGLGADPKKSDVEAAGISQEGLDRAKELVKFQLLGIAQTKEQLAIQEKMLSPEAEQLELAKANLAIESTRLSTLKSLGAEDTKILSQLLVKKEIEEKIRGIKESVLLREQAASVLSDQHATRNRTRIVQETVALHTSERQLQAAKDSGVASEATLRSLEAQVLARKRSLQVTKEQSIEEEKQAYASVAGDLAANIGTLNAGMGQTAQGLIAMGEGWRTLGDDATSSAEKIKAASQIAGGFQSALGGLISSAASMVASGIDLEIAAVKRSGATQEEQEKKIYKLQKRKIKEEEKYAKASILLNTAMGVARALGSAPPPINFILAGLTAAAGAMAYQQASNTAASQLANLGGGASGAAESMSIEVGSTSTPATDVSSAAQGSERAQMLGDQGVYGRASAGTMKANTPYITSESGRELVIPKSDSKIVNASDTEAILAGKGGDTFAPVIQVNALDSQSLEERMPEVLAMLQEQAEQQGFTLGA